MANTETKATQAQDLRNADGKYTYSTLDHGCKCGHSLGEHCAERNAKEKDQPCFADGCECTYFTKLRAPRVKAVSL